MVKASKCNLCIEECNSHKQNAHIECQHEVGEHRKKKNFKCNVCRHKFSNRNHLMEHTRTHTGERPFKCTIHDCGMAFKLQNSLKRHIKYKHSDERPFKCDFPGCLHTVKTSEDLTKHKRVHSDERPFACTNPGCSFHAKFKSDITQHLKCVHSEIKALACSKCDYKTAKINNLKRHMRRHLVGRDFKCSHPNCTEYFMSKFDLRSHFSNRHEERNIKCDHPDCGQKFENAKALSQHERTVHVKKSHACPKPGCSYSTKKSNDLVRHMVIHEGRNENISCLIEGCEYKGKNKEALRMHVRRHKTCLPCPVSACGQYAQGRKALDDHVKLHNPVGRPFQCPLCFKHFGTLHHLQIHCVVHTNEKPFACGHCELTAGRQTVIKSHISSAHADVKFPFIVHLLDDRECLRCKVMLPSAEFAVHSTGHEGPVMIL